MKYLIDANVLSEPTKPAPAAQVVQWLREHERDLAVDPIILGEIRFGIHLLPAGARRKRLETWFAQGIERIHCLSWDAAVGLRWAKLLAHLRASGQAISIKDSMIAATSLHHGLTLVTRNTRDYKKTGAKVIDPFVDLD